MKNDRELLEDALMIVRHLTEELKIAYTAIGYTEEKAENVPTIQAARNLLRKTKEA